MNINRKRLLCGYSIVIFFVGIIFIPVKSVWGQEQNIYTYKHTPIWNLVDTRHNINGYNPVYEIDISRIVLSLVIITLITIALYLVFDDKKLINK